MTTSQEYALSIDLHSDTSLITGDVRHDESHHHEVDEAAITAIRQCPGLRQPSDSVPWWLTRPPEERKLSRSDRLLNLLYRGNILTLPRDHAAKYHSLSARFAACLPPLPQQWVVFWGTLSLFAIVFLSLPAAYVTVALRNIIVPPKEELSILIDPLMWQAISGLMVCYFTFPILVSKGFNKRDAFVLSIMIPFGFVVLAHLINDYALKPSLAFDRAIKYNTSLEPPLTQAMLGIVGRGSAVPSGFTVRQTVICLLLCWTSSHPGSPLFYQGKRQKLFVGFLSLALFVLVVFERVYVGAHAFFDVFIGTGTGIILWLYVVIVVSSPVYQPMRERLKTLVGVWLIFCGAMLPYAADAATWILTSTLLLSIPLSVGTWFGWPNTTESAGSRGDP